MYQFQPQGVCSRQILFDINSDDTIKEVRFIGGCAGNTAGVAALLEGMNIDDAIERLSGIPCGPRPTSCPDQLAQALMAYKEMKAVEGDAPAEESKA